MVNDFRALNRYAFSGHRLLSGKGECGWQAAHVLGCFNKNTASVRERYLAYVKAGIAMGRRPELVGGGLIRSVGGWAEVKNFKKAVRKFVQMPGAFFVPIIHGCRPRGPIMIIPYSSVSAIHCLVFPAQPRVFPVQLPLVWLWPGPLPRVWPLFELLVPLP